MNKSMSIFFSIFCSLTISICLSIIPHNNLHAECSIDSLIKHTQIHSQLMRSRGFVTKQRKTRVALEEINSILTRFCSPQTALLVYSRENGSLCYWLFKKDLMYSDSTACESIRMNRLIKRLHQSLGTYSGILKRAPTRKGQRSQNVEPVSQFFSFDKANRELANALLPDPLPQHLQDIQKLMIVPVENIGIVPFALLKPFEDESYLIDHLSISVVPSLDDFLDKMRPINWSENVKFNLPLIIGNPDFSNDPEWDFPPLEGAEKEAKQVGKIFNIDPILGTIATRDLIQGKAVNSELLYFATHGVADNENPLDGSFLALSKGRWTAREIQHSKLNAKVAVLSACQTGLGMVHDGGIIGISRAFQIAGVQRVVMSLWSVDDEATCYMMVRFANLLKSQPPAEALRTAMIDAKEKYSSPSKWASFTVFGVADR